MEASLLQQLGHHRRAGAVHAGDTDWTRIHRGFRPSFPVRRFKTTHIHLARPSPSRGGKRCHSSGATRGETRQLARNLVKAGEGDHTTGRRCPAKLVFDRLPNRERAQLCGLDDRRQAEAGESPRPQQLLFRAGHARRDHGPLAEVDRFGNRIVATHADDDIGGADHGREVGVEIDDVHVREPDRSTAKSPRGRHPGSKGPVTT